MKMRDLERATGVNRETIRVYLREGLLQQPRRSARNVADYDEAHVRGIRSIRTLQRQGGVRLAQIKQALRGDPRGVPAEAVVAAQLEELVAGQLGHDQPLVPVANLLPDNPRAGSDARALHRVGAVTLRRQDGRPALTSVDATLVRLWGEMRTAGFNEAAGFAPSVVRIYVDAAQRLAELESRTFLDTVAGSGNEVEAAKMAGPALSTMLSFFGLIRMKALQAEFRGNSSKARRTGRRPK
jgi:DNA-binding transcriptional MerR regulator